jgi:carbamoyltransferase
LGNRSLLADSRIPEMKTKLNCIVKHREDIRPFCPVILAEEVENWFEVKKQTPSSAHMLLAYPIKENLKNKIPSALHVDGTCRIQALSKENNSRFYTLISEYNKITGVPIMINTSFNDREPIVCTPTDAVKTFLKTEIDYLAIGDFLVHKPKK